MSVAEMELLRKDFMALIFYDVKTLNCNHRGKCDYCQLINWNQRVAYEEIRLVDTLRTYSRKHRIEQIGKKKFNVQSWSDPMNAMLKCCVWHCALWGGRARGLRSPSPNSITFFGPTWDSKPRPHDQQSHMPTARPMR